MHEKKTPGAAGTAAGAKEELGSTNNETLAARQARYVIRLRWTGNTHRLRWLLKTLGHRFNMRALSIEEERP
jgi:hypothetical protein